MTEDFSRRDQGIRERRARVLGAAMHLADEGGYEAVQMRAVAERSGVALGTIYRYYCGKDEMLIAGFAGWLRRTRHRIEAGDIPGDSPGERLALLLGLAGERTTNRPILMGALVTALGTTAPSATEYKLEAERELNAIVVTALGPDSDVDALGIARVIGHVWCSSLTRWVSGMAPDGSVGEELVHAVRMLVSLPVRV